MIESSEDIDWDIIVRPNRRWFQIDFKELWKYKDLLFLLVRRDFVSFYKQTVLGPFWFFGQPIVTMFVYVFIFGRVAKIPTDGIPLPLFYMLGITAWTLFADSLRKTSTVLLDNVSIFGKVYFPRIIVPISSVLSTIIKYFFQVTLLVILYIGYYLAGAGLEPNLVILLYPILLLILIVQSLGIGLIIAAITVKYRDLSFAVGFGIQLLMFGTTVVYPLNTLSGWSKTLVSLHPTTYIIEGMRMGFFGSGDFGINGFLYVSLLAILLLFVGVLMFNRTEKNFIDSI